LQIYFNFINTFILLKIYNKIARVIFYKVNRKSSFKDKTFKVIILKKQIQNLITIKELGNIYYIKIIKPIL